MSETKLAAHVVEVIPTARGGYYWSCSCLRSGDVRTIADSRDPARAARAGGQRHVAAMERGR